MSTQSKRVNRLIQEHSGLNRRNPDSRVEAGPPNERVTEIRQELVELHRPEAKGKRREEKIARACAPGA